MYFLGIGPPKRKCSTYDMQGGGVPCGTTCMRLCVRALGSGSFVLLGVFDRETVLYIFHRELSFRERF